LNKDFGQYVGEEEEDDLYPCDNPIKKMKLGSYFLKDTTGSVDEKYQTWLSLAIKLDHYKTVNVRSTDEILDFMGDVGGFHDALFMIFASFGGFFSSRFVIASLAKDLFLEKKESYKSHAAPSNQESFEGGEDFTNITSKQDIRNKILQNFE